MCKKIFSFLFLFLLLFVNSCSNSRSKNNVAEIDVKQRSPLSDFFDSYDYVALETNDSVVISNIDNLKANDNMIAVQSGSKLFLFDLQGKNRGIVSNKGNANNEYVQLTDFALAGDSIYVLSSPQKKILVFDNGARFVRTIDLDNVYYQLKTFDNGNIILYSSNSNDTYNNFALLNPKNGEILNRLDKFENNESFIMSGMNPFIGKSEEGNLYISHPFETSLFLLTPDSFERVEEFTFNTDKQMTGHYGETPIFKLQEECQNQPIVTNLSNYYKINDYEILVFPLFGEYSLLSNIAKLENGKQTAFSPILEEIDKDFPYLSAPWDISNGKVLSSMNSGQILFIESNNGLSKFKDDGLEDTDNPVVFFHNLK